MGIYLSNMEMPKGCASCPFFDDECFGAYKCEAVQSWGSDTERASGCPLIPVPPHGRLIDAEKLKSYWAPDHSRYFDADCFIHTIDVAQTIIPASESKERPAFLPQYELTPRSKEG